MFGYRSESSIWDGAPDLGIALGLGTWARFVDESGYQRAYSEVIDLAESVETDAACAVYDDQARGATQLVVHHRLGEPNSRDVLVDAHGERDPVLVEEGFQRYRGHSLVVFEHGVKPEDGWHIGRRCFEFAWLVAVRERRSQDIAFETLR